MDAEHQNTFLYILLFYFILAFSKIKHFLFEVDFHEGDSNLQCGVETNID